MSSTTASPQATPAAAAGAPEPCNLCGADDFKVLYEAGVAQEGRVVRCNQCQLMYVNPRDRVELEDYRERGEGEQAGWELSPSSLERQRNQIRDYRHALDRARQHAPGGRVLEIGPNTGTLLNELKNSGMECVGLEPNSFAARYGREQFGLDMRTQTLDEAGLEANSFDVVVFLHVIEHVTDPLAVLQEIHRVLKPGGLMIVETPRYDTLMFKLMGKRERNIVDNWHLYFFETESLKRLVEKAGFRIDGSKIPSRTVTPSRIMLNIGKVTRIGPLEGLGHWMAGKKLNDWMALPLNIRDILRYYAIKPE